MSTYPRSGMQRILAGSVNPELRVTLRDQDGEPADAGGTVLCTITRADGTVLATNRATSDPTGLGTYVCALTTAEATTLDVLQAQWTVSGVVRATSWHRIVGGFMFAISDVQARPGAQSFDVAMIRVERDRITDLIEEHCGAVAPQYDLEQWQAPHHGSHIRTLHHRPVRAIRSVTVDGAAEDLADLEVDFASGVVTGDVWFHESCTIGYEHGLDAPPEDLRQAAIDAAVDRILRNKNTVGPRVRSSTNELGITQQFAYAGPNHPTGLDEVDAVIMRYARPRIGIG